MIIPIRVQIHRIYLVLHPNGYNFLFIRFSKIEITFINTLEDKNRRLRH